MASKIVKSTDVLIVGGGPVGTILNLLLNKCRVSNMLIEKRSSLSNRPRAHYISNRSMEVLRHLGHLDNQCQKLIPPLDQWRYISYVNDIGSSPIAIRDCFSQYYTYKNTYYDPYSPSKVGNLGQNILSLILNSYNSDDISKLEMDSQFTLPLEVRNSIDNSNLNNNNINFGTKLISFDVSDDGVIATLEDGNGIHMVKCKYLIGADGVKSTVKQKMGVTDDYIDEYKSYYVAVHFESDELQNLQRVNPCMLKFICGSRVAVLVWYHNSEFVLHIPCISKELQSTFDLEKCKRVVSEIIKVDFEIKNYTFWLQNMSLACNIVDKSDRIILLGDAAHQLIPSGGFGMNLGISDSYSLYWRLYYLLDDHIDDVNRKSVIQSYVTERMLVANYAIKTAGEAYKAGKVIPSLMGYNISMAGNLVKGASLCAPIEDVDRMVNIGTKFINYISSGPIIGDFISQNAKRYLCDENCPFRLTYPAADLNYNFIFPELKHSNSINLDTYFKLNPIGLKTSRYAWRVDPSPLIGKRIPHCWIYHEIIQKDGNNGPKKCVFRLSTLDFTSIFDFPMFIYLTMDEGVSIRPINSNLGRDKFFHINWVTNHYMDCELVDIDEFPIHRLKYGIDMMKNSSNDCFRVFSSGYVIEQFKSLVDIKLHSNIGIIIRPDGLIVDIIKTNL